MLIAAIVLGGVALSAQNSVPRPGGGNKRGSWGNSVPAPGSGSIGGGNWGNSLPAPGTGSNPGPAMPPQGGPSWGGGWGNPWYNPSWNDPGWNSWNSNFPQNAGTTSVIGVGYDAQGGWRTVPMTVQYVYNGAQYDVTVVNAWNPWTDMWNYNLDVNAYNTAYYLRGVVYDFYTVLSTGTYYFNL